MTTKVSVALAGAIALFVGTALLAARGQDRQGLPAPGTERPGQLTRGLVFIENRGRNEAIPVVVQDGVSVVVQNVATSATPMPVRLAGATPGAPPPPVVVRHSVQPWEYRTLSIPADVAAQGLTNLLTAPGNEGFEPAGVQLTSGANTLLVLKRPRP
jgi:hypothetical protein